MEPAIDHADEGAAAVEYGLIATAIAAVVVVVVFVIGGYVEGIFATRATASTR